ncbi:hypothetical protein A2709_00810 [candidate division WWE3 bacterium RIFCSPHIGHO2_01_FULL_43_9]|uniref:Glycoside hydrolase family 57 N-terminal domain-containing protein n=1 Tax=candidate division WWE3 bacterium RIFCSPHIGHO2_01_FULL_43_9 TaxID=1802618 RepID=A0A1F4V2I9_UNCKA|nr:MAG: hypothetical protein A2709_00810 [candidate division WWE3 bacterium RIFCSPHIGHO2_01_FULL_43_9]
MRLALFLHFYQPANQQKDILEAVVAQCYRPLLDGLLDNQRARLTLNVSGGLLESLAKHGFSDVIQKFKALVLTNRVEFTSTACYHAFLPLLPKEEINRQITLNNALLHEFLGVAPVGFFPPEMAFGEGLDDLVKAMGFRYMILDEISRAGDGGISKPRSYFRAHTSQLALLFRQRNPSNLIMSGIERESSTLTATLEKYAHDTGTPVIAMDGETFGHHRPGLEKVLLAFLARADIDLLKLSEVLDYGEGGDVSEIALQNSTWASSLDDIARGVQFISWNDPANSIHKWQWELLNLMLAEVESLSHTMPVYEEVRSMADRALASDQFFWASAKPWWSVEMIESGAFDLVSVLEKVPSLAPKKLDRAKSLYRAIVSTAFDWQRTGKIREMNRGRNNYQRIAFKDRTLGVGGKEACVYEAFVAMLKTQEQVAREKGEYEKAILWRDAIYKIETKNDIYDAINAIDLLRIEISNEEVEKTLDRYTQKFKAIRGGQPEQRSN